MFDVEDVIDGDYLVTAQLGRGGMGHVVKVVDADSTEYALKYCSDTDPEQRKRFAREVRVMQGISQPNVIRVLGENLKHDPPYFLMPVAEASLADELLHDGATESRALSAIRQICEGVRAIHNAGATRRDLKPLNALRMGDGTIACQILVLPNSMTATRRPSRRR
jgi:eukaryotic-like serine/threonine-protein kinase